MSKPNITDLLAALASHGLEVKAPRRTRRKSNAAAAVAAPAWVTDATGNRERPVPATATGPREWHRCPTADGISKAGNPFVGFQCATRGRSPFVVRIPADLVAAIESKLVKS